MSQQSSPQHGRTLEPENLLTSTDEAAAAAPAEPESPPNRTDTVIVFNEQTNYVSTKTIITIFLACASVDLVALMDQTTLAASLTIIGNALDAGQQQAWIANGYFITSTVGQLVYGRLSDIWSRKAVLLAGLAVFAAGSLAASLARTAAQLVVARALAGLGGGGLMSVAQMIVSDVVPLRERGKYQGILGAVTALANGIGPVIGGALASQSADSWRWIFRLNLPLTALATLCVLFFMPLKKVGGDWRLKVRAIDFGGVALSLAGATALILGLTWGGVEYPWISPAVLASIFAGLVVCVIFVLWQWKIPRYPLVPLGIFRSTMTAGACITMFINGWLFVVQIYYIPQFYQLVYGYNATKSGTMLLPITLVQTASSTLSGLVVHWVGRYRECILSGWVIWSIGLGLMSTLDETTGLPKQVGYSLLIGVGVGNTLQPALIAIQAGVPRKDMAVVTSFRNFVRNLGATFGLAISGTILNNVMQSYLPPEIYNSTDKEAILDNPQGYLQTLAEPEASRVQAALVTAFGEAFRIVFYTGAALAGIGFLAALFLMPQLELSRPDDLKLREEARLEEEKSREKV